MKIDIHGELRLQVDNDLEFSIWHHLFRRLWVHLNTTIPRQEFELESKI